MSASDELVALFAARRAAGSSLEDFIQQCEHAVSSDTQRKLLQHEIMQRFSHGEIPNPKEYEQLFPHFASALSQIQTETLDSAIDCIQPLEERLQALPCEFGDFEVFEQSGRDLGSVHYQAFQNSLERKVKLRALLCPTTDEIRRAKSIALLSHPNLESTINLLAVSHAFVIANQFEYGESLATLLDRPPQFQSDVRSVQWILGVGSALLEMHQCDIAHMNLTPDNILVREDDSVLLLNPGYWSWIREDATLGESMRHKIGFPYRCVTPPATARVDDIHEDTVALGIILFQLLTHLPLESFYCSIPLPEETGRLKKLILDQLEYAADVDPELKSICLQATIGAMEHRSWSLVEFCTSLQAWLERQTNPGSPEQRVRHATRDGVAGGLRSTNSGSIVNNILKVFGLFNAQTQSGKEAESPTIPERSIRPR